MTYLDLLARRSISPKRLVEPGPTADQIALMIQAACAAPDHRRLRPWRYILIDNQAREQLADLFEEAARQTHGQLNDEQRGRAREKAANGACLLAVVAVIQDQVNDVPTHEQWVSVGAAVQNILLAAQAIGFGSMLVSGDKVATQALRLGLGLTPGEQLLGFIALGTATKTAKPTKRPCVEQVLSVWPPRQATNAPEDNHEH